MGIDTLQATMVEARDTRDLLVNELRIMMDEGHETREVLKLVEAANDSLLKARNAISVYVRAGGEL